MANFGRSLSKNSENVRLVLWINRIPCFDLEKADEIRPQAAYGVSDGGGTSQYCTVALCKNT